MNKLLTGLITLLVWNALATTTLANCAFKHTFYVYDDDTRSSDLKIFDIIPIQHEAKEYKPYIIPEKIPSYYSWPSGCKYDFGGDSGLGEKGYIHNNGVCAASFTISEDESNCKDHPERTSFQVWIGTEDSPHTDTVPRNVVPFRGGRNCMLIIEDGRINPSESAVGQSKATFDESTLSCTNIIDKNADPNLPAKKNIEWYIPPNSQFVKPGQDHNLGWLGASNWRLDKWYNDPDNNGNFAYYHLHFRTPPQ